MKEKMKKLLKVFAVCVMAFVSCFTVFACKETPPTDPDTEQGTDSGQTPSGGGTTVVDYTVTESEWASAIAPSNFGNFTMRQDATNGELSHTQIFEFDGTSARDASEDYEEYYTKDGDKYYNYEKEGSSWKKTEIEEDDYETFALSNAYSFTMFTYDASYTYNSETHAYEAENITIGGMPFTKVALYFEDGVLVKLSYERTMSKDGTTFTIVSTMTLTYGSVVITLPTVTE